MTRYYAETPCEHGNVGLCSHRVIGVSTFCSGLNCPDPSHMCPGGTRTEVTIDYEAAAVEWLGAEPPEDYPGGQEAWDHLIDACVDQTIRPLIDIALRS